MTKIDIPFNDWSKNKLIQCKKIATSRSKKYGEVGDFFEFQGDKYIIVMIKKLPLWFIADVLYDSEGADSPDEFRNVWAKIHYRKPVDERKEYFYHFFKRIGYNAKM